MFTTGGCVLSLSYLITHFRTSLARRDSQWTSISKAPVRSSAQQEQPQQQPGASHVALLQADPELAKLMREGMSISISDTVCPLFACSSSPQATDVSRGRFRGG